MTFSLIGYSNVTPDCIVFDSTSNIYQYFAFLIYLHIFSVPPFNISFIELLVYRY